MVGNAFNCWNSSPVLFTTILHSLQAKEFAAAFSGFWHHHSDIENLLDSKGEKSHKQKPEFLTHRKTKNIEKLFCYKCIWKWYGSQTKGYLWI